MLGQNLAAPAPDSFPQGRREHVHRRGACPGLSTPMPTGDGLLVRLLPIGTVGLDAFAALCEAARAHGNGVIEITSRGSLQVRGLTPDSAPRFAAAVGALEIAAADGIPVLSNALTGLDPEEILDASVLARDLRAALARGSLGASLSPKVSVVLDGGGSLSLGEIAADIRLRAEATDGRLALRVSVAGDDASSGEIGVVPPAHAANAAVLLLEVIAQHGRDARARDVLATEGLAAFRAALVRAGGSCELALSRKERKQGEAMGAHQLRDGSLACGVGLAFGHTDANSLGRLIEAGRSAGASGVRPAAGAAGARRLPRGAVPLGPLRVPRDGPGDPRSRSPGDAFGAGESLYESDVASAKLHRFGGIARCSQHGSLLAVLAEEPAYYREWHAASPVTEPWQRQHSDGRYGDMDS